MFKYRAIKKLGNKLLPTLEKEFGNKTYFSAREVRSTVYKKNFNPSFLPLGYIISLHPDELTEVMNEQFPDVSVHDYKKEMMTYLSEKNYQGRLNIHT